MEDLVPRLRLLALEEDLQLYQFDPERKNYFCVWDSSKEEKPAPDTEHPPQDVKFFDHWNAKFQKYRNEARGKTEEIYDSLREEALTFAAEQIEAAEKITETLRPKGIALEGFDNHITATPSIDITFAIQSDAAISAGLDLLNALPSDQKGSLVARTLRLAFRFSENMQKRSIFKRVQISHIVLTIAVQPKFTIKTAMRTPQSTPTEMIAPPPKDKIGRLADKLKGKTTGPSS